MGSLGPLQVQRCWRQRYRMGWRKPARHERSLPHWSNDPKPHRLEEKDEG